MPSACSEPLETLLPGSTTPPCASTSPQQRICATRRESFVPVTVDPRPGRVIHCPDLNACLINETRFGTEQVDCQAIHFGYAIPVNVVPITCQPEFVQLELDSTQELSARAVSYLLNHHPLLNNNNIHKPTKMAATAKHDHRSKFHGENSGDEDIAAIAKQISDHAEAIYQTWKSRGLAPTEILNCHGTTTTAGKFGSVLSPGSSSVNDLLVQSPDNLEKLVSDFVVEDKARIAASRKSPAKNLPSSIQFALQKFEKNARENDQKPMAVRKAPVMANSNKQVTFINKYSQINPRVNSALPDQQHSEVFMETIETSSFNPTVSSESQKSIGNALEKSTGSSLMSWPLKNKLNVNKGGFCEGKLDKDYQTIDSSYLDQVALEEKRLINALKADMVLSDDFSEVEKHLEDEVESKPKLETKKTNSLVRSRAAVNGSNSPQNEVSSNKNVADYTKVKFNAAQASVQRKTTEDRKLTKSTKLGLINSSEQSNAITRSTFEPKGDSKGEDEVDNGNISRDDRDSLTSRWGPRINTTRPRLEAVPHPELTTQQKQHIRAAAASSSGTSNNPIRPFLTRGSVAERVMIFEKCPSELFLDKRGPRQPISNNWRNNSDAQSKNQVHVRDNTQQKQLPPHTTLQRHVKSNKSVHIPRFYFPRGKPALHSQVENTIARITATFQGFPSHRATRAQFHLITKACELPLYWKVPLFLAANGDQKGYVEFKTFLEFWKDLVKTHHDAASKFVRITTRGLRDSICPEDLFPLVQDVVETHPGLTFLKEATEFHSRYVHTVIARIFYCVNRSWSGKISLSELRRSNLLSVISILEQEEDINQVTDYFSYEHFYVIYCKFWELDRDHDLFIDKVDLTRHNDYALSSRIIDRIFSGAVTRGGTRHKNQESENKMSYTEFVWFLLSEEDKNHPTAIEYWFRCMDLDGDGYLSMYELEYFYEEQLHRMEVIAIETLPFEDCLCQMLDMIHPTVPGKISLSDLKKCKMTSIFFDTFFNVEKYLDHEQRDPFASARDHDANGHELSDWDRFAAEEYELLVAEESGNEQNDNLLYNSSNDSYTPNVNVLSDSVESGQVSSMNHQEIMQYDSCDSDDYAESDE